MLLGNAGSGRGVIARRSLMIGAGAAALAALATVLLPNAVRAAGQTSTVPLGQTTRPVTGPAVLSLDGHVEKTLGGVAIVGRNAIVELHSTEFRTVAPGILCDVRYDFVGGNDNTEATFTLKLLTKDKRVLATRTLREKKRLPVKAPDEHGGIQWSDITSPRIAELQFWRQAGEDIDRFHFSIEDIDSFHLEVEAK